MIVVVDASTKLLVAGAAGALGTANALRPLAEDGVVSLVAFGPGAVTSEIPLLHGGAHALVAAGLVGRGALSSWRGRIGLGLTMAACTGALALHRDARNAGTELEQALVRALGPKYKDRIVYPPRPEEGREKVRRTPVLVATLGSHRRFVRDAVRYGPYGRRNLLDVWARPDLPAGSQAPVVVQVHGGAWVFGSKTGQAYPLLSHLVERGWICVAVNYRLSPRATWPDHIIDVKRAIAWVKGNIARLGGDPGFVAITGGSAGGHLSALAALTAGDPAFQPGFEDADTSVQAAVPFYGVYDWTGTQGVRRDMVPFLTRNVTRTSIQEQRELFVQASPIDRVHPGAPPFFLLHGDRDVLAPVEQARRFARQMQTVSPAPAAYGEMHGAHHAFDVLSSTRTVHAVQAVERFLGAMYGRHLATTSTGAPLPTGAVDTEADADFPA